MSDGHHPKKLCKSWLLHFDCLPLYSFVLQFRLIFSFYFRKPCMIPSASNRIISVGFINHLPRFCWCLYQITKKQFTIARVLSVFLNTKQNFFSTVRSVSSYQRIKGTENFWIYLIIGYAFLQFVIDFPKYNAISRIGTLGQLFIKSPDFSAEKLHPFYCFVDRLH